MGADPRLLQPPHATSNYTTGKWNAYRRLAVLSSWTRTTRHVNMGPAHPNMAPDHVNMGRRMSTWPDHVSVAFGHVNIAVHVDMAKTHVNLPGHVSIA